MNRFRLLLCICYVCVNAHVQIGLHGHACARLWRSEVNVFFYFFPLYVFFFKIGYFIGSELTGSAKLVGQAVSGILLSPAF